MSDGTVVRRGIEVLGRPVPGASEVLTPGALGMVADLARRFTADVRRLLEQRQLRQMTLDAGARLDFLPETAAVRAGDWVVDPLPADLLDRRVEITGPTDRKMIINALNSGANVFMADFEDSNTPTWANLVGGQAHLMEAVRRTLEHDDRGSGKQYRLNERTATLCVRPRGWHLWERHLAVDGAPVPAALVDFGLFFHHNARALVDRGTGPYFYLPKMQSHLEARLWNEVFLLAQELLGLPAGTIKATVLIETLPAAFEMDEILYELREHSAGLNCGRWDYIFSFIKTLRADPGRVLPDRSQVTMEQPFLRAYTQLLVRTCHRRNVHAMGGMAAQIPIRNDPAANSAALERVRADKLREVRDGHDGTWVAHPGLVALAREVFDAHMPMPHQIHRRREDVVSGPEDLLRPPQGTRTAEGLRRNISVGLLYLESWLRGTGCVPIDNLMEDAATAEICRTQVWQWVHHGAALVDGRLVDHALVLDVLEGEMKRLAGAATRNGREERFAEARALFEEVALSGTLHEFLTLPAYERLVTLED